MKAKIITFILLASFMEIYAQNSGWVWINPIPQGNSLQSSSISDNNTAFIIGDYGTLLKTTNNGLNWNCVFTLPFTYYYTSIQFVNQSTAFASATYPFNNLYKTTDGANTWITLNTGLNEGFNNIFFYNVDTGVAVGNNGRLIKTNDGGNNWITVPPAITESYLEFIGFNNSSACFANTSTRLLKSFSMGENWLILPIPDSTRNIKDIFFMNENTGMYIGDFGYYGNTTKFVKTTDGGFSWTSYNFGLGVQMCSMYFINENTGYASSGDYSGKAIIRKTTNGGINWFIQKDSINNYLSDIKFFNLNTGFSAGDYGNLLTTTNGGLNWNFYSRGFTENISDIYFYNESTGFISTNNNKHLLKTINGGNSWDTVFIAPEYINCIRFVNNNSGFIGGGINFNQGIIYKTTNAGLNWISQTYFQFQPINDMHFLNEQTGYAIGRADNILKTTNGGINWEILSAGSTYTLFSLHFVNINTGFLSGSGARIYKTTDGGLEWRISTLGYGYLRCIRFVNELTGYVIKDNNPYLYKTTDQGITWNPVNVSFFSQMSTIFLADANTGYFMALDKIIKTTDCGLTWGYQYRVANELGCIYFINPLTGYLGGQHGKLLKTTNGGGNFVGVIKIPGSEVPKSFSLSQNYPNPFNPTTTIRFSLPIPSEGGVQAVKLVIYDILGREVTTLVNQQLQPGSYEVSWPATNYPSGVYFYKLITNEYTESRKMILIK